MLAVFWFGVPVVGSVVLLYFTVFMFFFTTLGMGTLVSTIAKTYIQAVQLIQFFLMPSMLLSGFIFPVAAMPPALQWLSYLVPLTYFLTIVRGVIIKGVGIEYLWPQIVLLTLLGARGVHDRRAALPQTDRLIRCARETVLACAPFSPSSSTKSTGDPTWSRVNVLCRQLLR